MKLRVIPVDPAEMFVNPQQKTVLKQGRKCTEDPNVELRPAMYCGIQKKIKTEDYDLRLRLKTGGLSNILISYLNLPS